VRYCIAKPLGRAGICHCRMCQKAFGSWGAALVSVPDAQFQWTRGEPSTFQSSAIVRRGFCSRCGTPLFMHEASSGVIDLAIGTLDDPNAVTPDEQVGLESKLAWFDTLPGLPGHRTQDERTPQDMKSLATLQHPDHDTSEWPPQ
jgi:hypothetical protein